MFTRPIADTYRSMLDSSNNLDTCKRVCHDALVELQTLSIQLQVKQLDKSPSLGLQLGCSSSAVRVSGDIADAVSAASEHLEEVDSDMDVIRDNVLKLLSYFTGSLNDFNRDAIVCTILTVHTVLLVTLLVWIYKLRSVLDVALEFEHMERVVRARQARQQQRRQRANDALLPRVVVRRASESSYASAQV